MNKQTFLRNWRLLGLLALITFSGALAGYLFASWQVGLQASTVMTEQKAAYDEAADSRKATMDQCLTNNARLTAQLTALNAKSISAADKATEAANKATTAITNIDKAN